MTSEVTMLPDICRDVVSVLQRDFGFKVSSDGNYLQQGKCPACNKKELWAYADNPWVVMCSRSSKCGHQFSTKEMYPELFTNFIERCPPTKDNPNATAIAYLVSRGLDTALMRGFYEQGKFNHPNATKKNIPTVRFAIGGGTKAYMERLIEPAIIIKDGEIEKRKQHFDGKYGGMWWQPPTMQINDGDEVWITEAIIDTLSLWQNGVKSVAILTCKNYPTQILLSYKGRRVRWIWALDNDTAGREATEEHVARMRAEGWEDVGAAQSTEKGNGKKDWNDLLLRGELSEQHRKKYLYFGSLLIASSAQHKGELMADYSGRTAFPFDFNNRLYWCQLKQSDSPDSPPAYEVIQICNALPEFLYSLRNEFTGETAFYLHIHTQRDHPASLIMSSGAAYVNQEFGKKLLSVKGAVWKGNQRQLLALLSDNVEFIPEVKAIDFLGYVVEDDCYVFHDVAIHNGSIFTLNERDYFSLPKLAIRSTLQSTIMTIAPTEQGYCPQWTQWLWEAFQEKGYIALSFWFASLFAQQIRTAQSSFPFLEIIGEPGSGKTSLLEFLWKLLGQENQEGFDPHKFSHVANLRKIAQVSNLPTVYIEADRSEDGSKRFDWESIKPFYNGRGGQGRGVRNAGNDTQEFTFRGSLVIAQNNPIQASDAVLERIIRLELVKKSHSETSREAAYRLHEARVSEVSYFTTLTILNTKKIIPSFTARTKVIQEELIKQHKVANARIAKNYSQMITALEELCRLLQLPAHCLDGTRKALIAMCQERGQSILEDVPMVKEFWDMFDYINEPVRNAFGQMAFRLDHSNDDDIVAINLNEVIQVAAEKRQQVPPLRELQKQLKNNAIYPFLGHKVIRSAVILDESHSGKLMRCWLFRRPKTK